MQSGDTGGKISAKAEFINKVAHELKHVSFLLRHRVCCGSLGWMWTVAGCCAPLAYRTAKISHKINRK